MSDSETFNVSESESEQSARVPNNVEHQISTSHFAFGVRSAPISSAKPVLCRKLREKTDARASVKTPLERVTFTTLSPLV